MKRHIGAPCRFEDASLSWKTKMKICSKLKWRMKMWRTQFTCMLKNEDKTLPHLLKTKIAFWKKLWRLKTRRARLKIRRKWILLRVQGAKFSIEVYLTLAIMSASHIFAYIFSCSSFSFWNRSLSCIWNTNSADTSSWVLFDMVDLSSSHCDLPRKEIYVH